MLPTPAAVGQGVECWGSSSVVLCQLPCEESLPKAPVISEFQSSNQVSTFGLIPLTAVWDFLATKCPVFVAVVDLLALMTVSVTWVLCFLFKMYFLLLVCRFLQGDLVCLGLYCL